MCTTTSMSFKHHSIQLSSGCNSSQHRQCPTAPIVIFTLGPTFSPIYAEVLTFAKVPIFTTLTASRTPDWYSVRRSSILCPPSPRSYILWPLEVVEWPPRLVHANRKLSARNTAQNGQQNENWTYAAPEISEYLALLQLEMRKVITYKQCSEVRRAYSTLLRIGSALSAPLADRRYLDFAVRSKELRNVYTRCRYNGDPC